MNNINHKGSWLFYVLTVLAFMVASFAVQAVSHFVINANYYAAIPIMRKEPIMELGILTMLLQGTILACLFPRFYRSGSPVLEGLKYSLSMGLFLGSYIALAEAAKYAAPSISQWIMIEGSASLIQFALFGVLLGLIYSKTRRQV